MTARRQTAQRMKRMRAELRMWRGLTHVQQSPPSVHRIEQPALTATSVDSAVELLDSPPAKEAIKQSPLDGVDIEALVREYGSVKAVAEKLGVTRQAIYNRRKVAA